MTDGKFSLTRSIIHNCLALRPPQTWLQALGNCAQIIPLPGIPEAAAQEIVDRLNAAPEAPESRSLTDAMVEAAGRALSDRHANACGCGMDKDIMWGSYSDEFKEQARVALGAAHEIKENSND